METTTSIKPKTLAELLPGLSGIITKDAMQTLTARKKPRSMAQTSTAEKVMKPLTIAEMRAEILALKVRSPKRPVQAMTSAKKRNWNSSVKVDNKKISHTANGQMKHDSVRKVLNFQPKPKAVSNPTPVETPKFPKLEFKQKKSTLLQANNNLRISGICKIPETPLISTEPIRQMKSIANKENILNPQRLTNINKKLNNPTIVNHKFVVPEVMDTPKSNESWKSSCDASFLMKEKEIHDVEEITKALCQEQILENIAEVSPPVSTPFKEYRNVKEYFNNSSEQAENSASFNDTIMCFEKPCLKNENNEREESVIVSLCNMLNKATAIEPENTSTELQRLLEVKKQTELNIRMIENGIQTLDNIKKSHLKSLEYITKLLKEKQNGHTITDSHCNNTLTELTKETAKLTIEQSPGNSVIVKSGSTKSPIYKIPKKNQCLRKKVFYKSMPNVSNSFALTPDKKLKDKALSVYMEMKEHMNFLNTPVTKKNNPEVLDTPMVTSHNLQRQLDKLYTEN
ncbi:uncharacterized protein LOC101742849 [Bombyx mori]|uniref:Uncharacterized protein n=1 Tax=Bombyx mori TaxID=7091 RepID=A0A8R1WML8_BOMMO|nr:uncharacterized protein LOC101742849 [Bombyx mori]